MEMPNNYPPLVRFTRSIGGVARPIPITALPGQGKPGPKGNCYWNVEAVVRAVGGRQIYGWLVSWWPDKFIDAIHHCVWKSENGEIYIDFTDASETAKGYRDFTYFIETGQSVDYNSGDRVPKKVELLTDNPDATLWREAELRQDHAYQRYIKLKATRNFSEMKRWAMFHDFHGEWRDLSVRRMIHSLNDQSGPCPCGSGRTFHECHFDAAYDPARPLSPKMESLRTMPYPSDVNSITQNGPSAGVRRQGRNETCACGSGKKFKHCCGHLP